MFQILTKTVCLLERLSIDRMHILTSWWALAKKTHCHFRLSPICVMESFTLQWRIQAVKW